MEDLRGLYEVREREIRRDDENQQVSDHCAKSIDRTLEGLLEG